MMKDEEILRFYSQLELKDPGFPADIKSMNPYQNTPPEVAAVIQRFYRKYYHDDRPRGLILGINPGRFGAGITGIPFTDSYRLQQHCNISFPGDTRETSSLFIYDVISAYGGAAKFYGDWFIGAVSPLGFIRKNEKENWVNWNYYDQKDLEKAVRPFIIDSLKKQIEISRQHHTAVVLGTGKNFRYLQQLNASEKLFEQLIPLEHPRYIMQYKLKAKEVYVQKFLQVLKSVTPSL